MRSSTVGALAGLALLALTSATSLAQTPAGTLARTPASAVARVAVTRPTVIAYLVVPEGAVDTIPDFAVTADDWSYAQAALGDSLEARGLAHVLVTESRLRVASRGARPVTIPLGEMGAAGYVFARPGAHPCLRRGWLDPDSVLATASRFFAPAAPVRARPATCDPIPLP